MTNPQLVVDASPVRVTFIVWPRPEMQVAWHAEFVLASGKTQRCHHQHRTEAAAAKCGKRGIRTGTTWM